MITPLRALSGFWVDFWHLALPLAFPARPRHRMTARVRLSDPIESVPAPAAPAPERPRHAGDAIPVRRQRTGNGPPLAGHRGRGCRRALSHL